MYIQPFHCVRVLFGEFRVFPSLLLSLILPVCFYPSSNRLALDFSSDIRRKEKLYRPPHCKKNANNREKGAVHSPVNNTPYKSENPSLKRELLENFILYPIKTAKKRNIYFSEV